jgi:cytochrome c553
MSLRPLASVRNSIDSIRGRSICSERMGRAILLITLTLCPATMSNAQPTDHPPNTIEARLLACAACHGRQGQGTENDYFPRLAGKPAGYLMNQLVAFRDGRRRYPR